MELPSNVLHPSHRVGTEVLELLDPATHTRVFPGALPKGLRNTSLNYLASHPSRSRYLVTAKLDGTRLCVIVCQEGIFLVDRTLGVFRLNRTTLQIPLPPTGKHSILDGELVDNRYFFAFDALVIRGLRLEELPFTERYRQCCLFLEEVHGLGTLQAIPKRMHSLEDIDSLFGMLVPDGDPHSLRVLPVEEVVHVHWSSSVEGTCAVDGLIFLDQTESFRFSSPFGLLKWKPAATVDVLVDMKDLCSAHGEPRREDRIQTYFWEYSEILCKSVRVPFHRCQTSGPERVSLWLQRMQLHDSSTVCVECYCTPAGWRILRCRPDKHRSNSARTIRDTVWIEEEGLTLSGIRKRLDRQLVAAPVLPIFQSVCEPLTWLGYTWARAGDMCELELRLTYEGLSSIPASMFYTILRRLQQKKSLYQTESETSDYAYGSVRVTEDGARSVAIRKERGFSTDLVFPVVPPFGLRCVLSYEHPCPLPNPITSSDCTTRRQKRRWRFLHRETVSIECTYVQTTDYRNPRTQAIDSYEIEIELLHQHRYRTLPYQACHGLILSMLWRMLVHVLGVSVKLSTEDSGGVTILE